MPICAEITQNVLVDCDTPLVGGANDRLLLMNKTTWENATITRDVNNPRLITNIVLPTGEDAFNYEGKNSSVEPRSALVVNRYSEVYDHEVIFKVFANSAAVKTELESLAKGLVVAIVQNNHKGADGQAAFEVYGDDAGLKVQELQRTVSDTDTQGAYNLVLRSAEQAREGHLPATIFDTDFATTKALIDGLVSAV